VKFIILLIFFLIIPLFAFAENNLGLAYYAIQHKDWPCARSLEVFKDLSNPRLSFLWRTFGDDLNCVERFLQLPTTKTLHVHLVNETCQRDSSCGKYEFVHGLSIDQYRETIIGGRANIHARLSDYLKPLQTLLQRYREGLTCSISPGLESNLSPAAAKIIIARIRPIFPHCSVVWNPVGNNRFGIAPISGTTLELHGSEPKLSPPCIAGLDGQDIALPMRSALLRNFIDHRRLPQYFERMKQCSANYLWISEFSGIANEQMPDPRARINFPTAEQFHYFQQLLRLP